MSDTLALLNAAAAAERLENLRRLDPAFAPMEDHINNHIHTTFSFSPYSPRRRPGKRALKSCAPPGSSITTAWAATASSWKPAKSWASAARTASNAA